MWSSRSPSNKFHLGREEEGREEADEAEEEVDVGEELSPESHLVLPPPQPCHLTGLLRHLALGKVCSGAPHHTVHPTSPAPTCSSCTWRRSCSLSTSSSPEWVEWRWRAVSSLDTWGEG